MKKITAIVLSILMILATFSFTVMAEGENPNIANGEVNYAFGKSYTYAADYEYMNADTGSILTDGILPYDEANGVSVVFLGSAKPTTIKIDLGKVQNDISKVVFNVRDSLSFSGDNRGFSGEKSQIKFSTDGETFTRNKDFVMEKEIWSESGDDRGYYNYVFNFNSDVKARYVEVTIYSPSYVLCVGEIQVVGGEAIETESSAADESTADESTADESIADDSTADESTADESTADESTADESTADESTADESTADESTADESTADESTVEESSEAPAPSGVNYAEGKSYTIDGTPKYLDGKADDGSILTDGSTPDSETPFESVAFSGSGAVNTITLNLGKKYTDINTLKFGGVRIAGNRQFANIVIEVSNNGKDFTAISADKYEYVETETETVGTFTIEYKFKSDITAKYVRTTLTSKEYVLTFGEIEVIGDGAEGEVTPDVNETPGDAGFVVVALVAVISLAGAVIVSKRKFN